MLTSSPFIIYDASAGSGKTYTLVKSYLKVLLQSRSKFPYQNILAITFTNKAVAEMKTRVVQTLKQFSNTKIISQPTPIFNDLVADLEIQPIVLQQNAKTLLNTILHDYAGFNILTIDGFTHKLIRTFAHDLKIPVNFEVELDQEALITEAVEALIAKAGTETKLTKTLIDFAIEKANEDKSWDISRDFNTIAKLLVNETDYKYITQLKDKTFDDFFELKTLLINRIAKIEHEIITLSKQIIAKISKHDIDPKDFSGGYLHKHFVKLSSKNFNVSFDTKWQQDIENKPLYPKRITGELAKIIDSIQPEIVIVFKKTKQALYDLKLQKAIYKNSTPLSVLQAINTSLTSLKEEKNKLLISEFNHIINQEIKDQPTPFIYERLGEKYRHYFVDEFQDTSFKQWHNLVPLIDNALSSENIKEEKGSLMLVGDAKQAIYRWRGGEASQFLNLISGISPFNNIPDVKQLQKNYRSYKTIIEFNNRFFKFLGAELFQEKTHKTLYENAAQNPVINSEGYVNIQFLQIEKHTDKHDYYATATLNSIKNCLTNGFALNEICILVRKKSEGVAISTHLNENNIPIISSETLLINNANEVPFIINIIKLLYKWNDKSIKLSILNQLANWYTIEDKHAFFIEHIDLETAQFFKALERFKIYVNPKVFIKKPLYQLVESLFSTFHLMKKTNAYIQFFLDLVLEFSIKQQGSVSDFINYFEKKQDQLSIISSENQEAVSIMTIHKSKGLEFPVVIFPYANLDLYRERAPKAWLQLNPKNYAGFDCALLNYNKDFEHYNNQSQHIYQNHQAALELDNINLLYVALTRAEEQLHILSEKPLANKTRLQTYGELFYQFLKQTKQWDDNKLNYTFGNESRELKNKTPHFKTKTQKTYPKTTRKQDHIKIATNSGYLWDTNQQEAIEKGNIIHQVLSKIEIATDINKAITHYLQKDFITKQQAKQLKPTLKAIVNHPKLKQYYTNTFTIYNEREIISNNGSILRPDRLLVNTKKQAIIIDYKTGLKNPKYKEQLQNYQDIIESMDYVVIKKLIIYINNTITVESL